jgi:hypothetical protein
MECDGLLSAGFGGPRNAKLGLLEQSEWKTKKQLYLPGVHLG